MNIHEKARPGAASPPHPVLARARRSGNFYVATSLAAFGIIALGFGPAIIDPSTRKAPLSAAVALHGMIFTAWIVLFLAQTLLLKAGQVRLHRRLGILGAVLAVLMIVTGYLGSVAMGRRGFDLSGELNAAADPLGTMVFQLGDLLAFGVLVGAAIVYRGRAETHKRLMHFATIGSLMGAPLAHIFGRFPALQAIPPLFPVSLLVLYSTHAVYDRMTRGRIHPVSLWAPLALFAWANIRAIVIGPSAAWHEFAAWLVR